MAVCVSPYTYIKERHIHANRYTQAQAIGQIGDILVLTWSFIHTTQSQNHIIHLTFVITQPQTKPHSKVKKKKLQKTELPYAHLLLIPSSYEEFTHITKNHRNIVTVVTDNVYSTIALTNAQSMGYVVRT